MSAYHFINTRHIRHALIVSSRVRKFTFTPVVHHVFVRRAHIAYLLVIPVAVGVLESNGPRRNVLATHRATVPDCLRHAQRAQPKRFNYANYNRDALRVFNGAARIAIQSWYRACRAKRAWRSRYEIQLLQSFYD